MDYKKIYESKNATITLDSFYSENERMTKEPFPFPITVLLNEGDGYEQTYADTNYSLIEITNVTEKNFPTGVYRPENFNQHAWTSFETDAVYDMEDFIFHFGNNTTAHGYKELVKIIQKKNPNLDIKPDPFWLKPVTFRVEIGGSLTYDYFYNMHCTYDNELIRTDPYYIKKFRGVYVATISTDIKEMLYNKYKLPVIKNDGPLYKKSGDVKHINMGRFIKESVDSKQNFFDELDSDWNEVITNTYKEANEYKKLVQFTNNNDNDVLYFRNPKNIKVTDFKISYSIYKGVIRVAFNLIIPEDEGLSIFKDKHIPIYDLKMNFHFYINLYNRKNSRFPSSSVLMFSCKEKETDKEILYSDNQNLKYSNYGEKVKEILEKIKEDIIQANSSQNIRFNPYLLKRLSKNYGDFLEKMKNE